MHAQSNICQPSVTCDRNSENVQIQLNRDREDNKKTGNSLVEVGLKREDIKIKIIKC